MPVTIDQIKELRAETGAGVMDCRQALTDANGDMEQARLALREKGIATAAKRADRAAGQGLIHSYIHGGRIGVLVDLRCETDFVAKTDQFKELAHDIAMQIASMNPAAVSAEQMPADAEPESVALLDQEFIRDGSQTVADRINDVIASIGEKVEVARFTRYEMGE
ncbi:MAG: translation elongation factor Ts [Chloroflexi bacterium]|nr:translation elongation factor Ts [Chloroflexota bacterium]MYF21897.1 translation elongation factor Ts [Chloroflexota bacterium]